MSEEPKFLNAEEIQGFFDRSPFIGSLKLEVLSSDPTAQEISVKMPMQPSMERRAGTKQFHGGPIASFVDVVGDFAIGMMVGGGVPTINIRIDYLKPAVGDALVGVARVRRHGRSVAVVDIDVLNEKNSLVAMGRGTYSPQTG
ncbi:MAG: PaaI family thioesterase [Alphaproteobacteria bacterium]|nr:PaaI family thioesterase [Alphaproteobacteria bacterium]MDP6257312.1 PaaI family thioesterase [Alphaproteobacteria bacterium]MDP7053618.1 PaaI family thioesterase [Alphaproteobacteria bacterium]MDP7227705.1 PaaI family thioesterase [Alphaproteobacteria bacterium]MDP7459935.1 PaaI family thioesterase [Alphaproteobacteria bacterium]